MAIRIDRKGLLDSIVSNSRAIDDLDARIGALQVQRADLSHKISLAEETIKALGRDIATIEVVELRYSNIPIPRTTEKGDKGYIGVTFATIMQEKFDAMPIEKGAMVYVKTDKMRFTRTRLDIRKSSERLSRGIDANGFEIVEYAEIAYIDADTYQRFYMQASGKWYDEALVRYGLKARLISKD